MSIVTNAIDFYDKLTDLVVDHAKWSQATFGLDSERGPIGPLKHLEKEAKEAYEAYSQWIGFICGTEYEDKAKEKYETELADCFLLLLDAMRRSGVKFGKLIELATVKLQVCKARHYPRPEAGNNDAVEHDRILEMKATDDGMPVSD